MGRELIIVLGMHRSGTSLLAKGISELGYFIGETMQGTEDNSKGYFENEDIVMLNELILDELSVSWKTCDYVYINRCRTFLNFIEDIYFERAVKILEEIFDKSNKCVIKDPRISILMPFWERVFERLNINYKYVLSLRNPSEVSRSLVSRRDVDYENGLKLWLYYNTIILENLKKDVMVINYSDLIDYTKETMNNLYNWLEIDDFNIIKNIENFSKGFVEKGLKHQNNEDKTEIDIINKMYLFLNQNYLEPYKGKTFFEDNLKEIEYFLHSQFKSVCGQSSKLYVDKENGKQYILSSDIEPDFSQKLSFSLKAFGIIKNLIFVPIDDECIVVMKSLKSPDITELKFSGSNAAYESCGYSILPRHGNFYIADIDKEIDTLDITFELYPMDMYSLSIFYKIKERKKTLEIKRNFDQEISLIRVQLNKLKSLLLNKN